jgi:hypothetical protein
MDANVLLQQDLARIRHAEDLREATQRHRLDFDRELKPAKPRRTRTRTIARLLARIATA